MATSERSYEVWAWNPSVGRIPVATYPTITQALRRLTDVCEAQNSNPFPADAWLQVDGRRVQYIEDLEDCE